MASPSVEDYIKAIYDTQQGANGATTHAIAARLSVSAPSASKMLKRLDALRFVVHRPYRAVSLTDAGLQMALRVVRRHRLLELYLVQALGYTWDEVHEEADVLEHHLSENLESRIDARLGHPSVDPHGEPIPTRDGRMPAPRGHPLAQHRAPGRLLVDRVGDTSGELLRHLQILGLVPGAIVEFVEQEPFGGAFVFKVGGLVKRVSPQAAEQVYVEPVQS